jgi:hypothetical protein
VTERLAHGLVVAQCRVSLYDGLRVGPRWIPAFAGMTGLKPKEKSPYSQFSKPPHTQKFGHSPEGNLIRIISARKASTKESKSYT